MKIFFFRFVPVVLALLFLLLPQNIHSQNNCSSTLDRAETLFEQGLIEDIPELLEGCIINGFTQDERRSARKLIILAYIFDNNMARAEGEMVRFLRENPEYQLQAGDPAEFTSLFLSFRTLPDFSLGAFFGGNLTSATMLTTYGPYNPASDENYFSFHPETQLGAAISFFLANSLEINVETIYLRNSFTHNLRYNFAEVYKKETHHRFELPLTLTYDLPAGNLNPYFRAGASYGFLLGANTSYSINQLSGNTDIIESENRNIRESRNTSVFSAIVGAGIKFKIPRGHIFFDMRYYYGLTDLVKPENRWDQETTFRYYYTDGDFVTDNLSISVGYRHLFYKTIKN